MSSVRVGVPALEQITVTPADMRFATYNVDPLALSKSAQGSSPALTVLVTGFDVPRTLVRSIRMTVSSSALVIQAHRPEALMTGGVGGVAHRDSAHHLETSGVNHSDG